MVSSKANNYSGVCQSSVLSLPGQRDLMLENVQKQALRLTVLGQKRCKMVAGIFCPFINGCHFYALHVDKRRLYMYFSLIESYYCFLLN